MASEWELGMGMGFGYGVGPTANSPTYLYGLPSTDTLRIDDLLDLSRCHDKSSAAAASVEANLIPKQESSEFIGGGHFVGEYPSVSNVSSFADDIYVPSEEAAELEWLSKFMEDSFTDAPYPSNYSRSYPNALPAAAADAQLGPTNTLPGRGGPRTKRSRGPAAASSSTSSSSSSDFPPPAQISIPRRKSSASSAAAAAAAGEADGGARRCTHCASEKTPQWRTGPMGPKTLCNACGVRYKSGRLVPEYRPAASPTFVLTQHSNSHRKVMELRRQKEQIHVLRRDQLIG